jgi:hypothetical protein
LELRRKQKEVSSKNGVVGSIGRKTPITPKLRNITPNMMYKYRTTGFIVT